jgi:hypothetical protein
MDDALPDTRKPLSGGSAVAIRSRVALVLRTMPAWAWLGALFVMSCVVGIRVGFETHAPIVFNDELIYSELARGLADSHLGTLGSVVTSGYGVVYPLLLSPIYAAVHQSPTVYALVKGVNAVVFASAVVPAFLLARRLLPNQWSLAVAALTVLGPQAIYSALVMTENVFLPIFLWTCVAAVRMLERPTSARQLVAGATIVVAVATRFQAVALGPGLAAAIVLAAVAPGPRGALVRLKPYRLAALIGASVVPAAAIVELIRGRTLGGLLGSYGVLAQGYSAWGSIKWTALNLADLDLLVGVAVFAILPAAVKLALRSSAATESSIVLGSLFVGFGGAMLILVGVFSSSSQGGHRVHDRYVFYLLPLALTLGFWALRRRELPTRIVVAGACVAGALPATIPFHLVKTWGWVDAIGLLPWQNTVFSVSHMAAFAIPTALVIAAAVAVVTTRRMPIVIATLGLAFLFGFTSARAHARLNGEFAARHAEWIDRAVGTGANVKAVYVSAPCQTTGQRETRWIALWRAKYFNRSVQLAYYIGAPMPREAASRRLVVGNSGVLLRRGMPVDTKYVLVEKGVTIRGTLVARERGEGLSLVRTEGHLDLLSFSPTSACVPPHIEHGRAVRSKPSVHP